MIKALIIDDEQRTRELISKMIDSFGYNIISYPLGENVQSGVDQIEKLHPDIVFLDVQMPDGTGFDVLKQITFKDFQVIFITAHEEFAIKAIKFSALDYLLKPIDLDELQVALDKAIQNIEGKNEESQFETLQHNIQPHLKRKLVLKTLESIHVVELDDIVRCEADKNYTHFYLHNEKRILVSKTLKEYEMILAPYHFLRIHQSHLINMNYVDRYDKGNGGAVVMKDGAEVPLSSNKRDLFFHFLETL